ncbi:uncharacterized protein LOC142889274 isoform X2 [Nelusetta ayraudi]|uniref:uncharacterized protein LOC142889274 isoform X2 n=1 Tax=Nelusetta ayraudi TaxID=303726 RepID=UPI003F6E8BFF
MLPLLFCVLIGGKKDTPPPPPMHYRLKNDSLCLQVSVPAKSYVNWLFNENKVIVYNNVVADSFINKVDYKPENNSLCINELTSNDSGIYTIAVFNLGNRITYNHRLQVQDAVPKPVLSISPLLSNQSAQLCNMTANCSIQEEWVMSVCGQESCTVTHRSLHRYNITVVAANNTIICIGSNHVSNSSVSASTDLCQSPLIPTVPQTTQLPALIKCGIVIVVIFALVLVILLLIFFIRKLYKNSAGATQPEEPPGPREGACGSSAVSREDATAAQANQLGRGSPSGPSGHSHPSGPSGPSDPSDPEHSLKTDTVYSFLKAPNAATCVDKRAEAPSEAETGVDTVYCLLQKPQTAARS